MAKKKTGGVGGAKKINASVRKLHVLLIKHVFDLSKRLDGVTDAGLAQAIVGEQQEYNHRVNLLAAHLFRKDTESLRAKVSGIDQANGELAKAIKTAQTAAQLVAASTAVLGIVDEVLDLIKIL